MTTPDGTEFQDHVAAEQLAMLAEGTLRSEESGPLLRHIAVCRSCAAAYVDAVRYRAAWLASPDLFDADDRLQREGLRVANASEVRLAPSSRTRSPWTRRLAWPIAALGTAAAVVALITWWPRTQPMVDDLPAAVIAALETAAAQSLVLPGGEAGAALEPVAYRGHHVEGRSPLRMAVDSCAGLYQQGARNAHLAYVVGAGNLALGQLRLASDYASEGLGLDPDDAALLVLAAELSLRNNDPEQAEAHLRRALRRRPDDPVLRLDLAIVLRERGERIERTALLRSLAESRAPSAIRSRADRLLSSDSLGNGRR